MRVYPVVCATLLMLARTPAVAQRGVGWKEALDHAYALGQRYQNFGDRIVAVRSLARLGGVVCRYDPAYAKTLFTSAANTLFTVTDTGDYALTRTRAFLLAQQTPCWRVSPLTLFDSVRAAQFRRDVRWGRAADTVVAAELAMSAALSPLDEADARLLVEFLGALRRAGLADVADDIFLARVGWERLQPEAQPIDYLILGGYVFGSPAGLNEEVVMQYADGALEALSVPTATSGTAAADQDLKVRHSLVVGLLPEVQEFAPALTPRFIQLLVQLGGGTDGLTMTEEAATRKDHADEEKRIREAGDPVSEDDVRVRLIAGYWPIRATKRMRELAAGIHDPDTAMQLDQLITFAEAVTDPRAAARLQPSTESALLWLSKNNVSLAVRDAKYAWPEAQPLLLLAAARATVNIRPKDRNGSWAWRLLRDAVDAYNAEDRDAAAAATADSTDLAGEEAFSTWDEVVDTGISQQRFPLREIVSVDGLDLRSALPPLAAADPDRVEEVLRQMRNEERQAEALTYVAGARLAKAFTAAHPQERPGEKKRASLP